MSYKNGFEPPPLYLIATGSSRAANKFENYSNKRIQNVNVLD